MKRILFKALGLAYLLFANAFVGNTQAKSGSIPKELFSHGTCATAILSPFGAAFIIDSRITTTDQNGALVSQSEGCKVLLPRPKILIAGVGLEDTTGNYGHWNSLDEAQKALSLLPQDPTEQQLNNWSSKWGFSLVNHFRAQGSAPSHPQKVSEMILITKIGDEPYYRRTTVEWDGSDFHVWVSGQNLEKQNPYILYSGACREFVVHASDEGGDALIPAKYRTFWEEQKLNEIGARAKSATTTEALVAGAYGLEDELTQIDDRVEGERAVIAPPYATAEWREGAAGWTTHFNEKCDFLDRVDGEVPIPVSSQAARPANTISEPTAQVDKTPQKKRSFFRRIFGENRS
jgi:hypothetical protein